MKKIAFYSLLIVLLSAVSFSCSKRFDTYSQGQVDKQKIDDFIATHSLTPSGELSITTSAPTGSIPLADTAKQLGNMYIIHTQEGKGISPTENSAISIRYKGYYLANLQEFTSTIDNPTPFKLHLSGAIQGFRTALPNMRTAAFVAPDQYISPGQAWLIIPSTMGFGNTDLQDPKVPANTCLIYKVILYQLDDL